MSDRGVPKICEVCGNKALGKNFGALSCEPCKAFFRRNALKETLKCHFNGNCKIDIITRKFCSKCRLDKCLAIGMRKDFILKEVERDWRRVKGKGTKNGDNKGNGITEGDTHSGAELPSLDESSMNGMCDRNDFLYDILDDNNFSVEELNKQIMDIENGVQSDSMDDTNTCPTSDDDNDISMDVLQRAVEFELAVIPIARPVSEYHNDFNTTESYLLNELFNSTKIIGQPLTKITLEITNMEEFNRTVSFKFDRGIRNFTRGVKGLTAFKNILHEDRISLLKYGCVEALLMRTVMHVDYQEECMRLPWDKENSLMFKLQFLKSFKPEVYNSYIRYLSKMSPIWDSDVAIIDLMLAIILFNPDRPNLINRDVVKVQQHMYMYLLERYLILKYRSECEAKSRFLRLMNTLNDVNILREMQKKHTLHLCNSSLVTPLLQEVFDVKPTAPVVLDSPSIDFIPSPISSDL